MKIREYRESIPDDNFEIANISVEGWRYAYKGIISDELLNSLDANKRAQGRTEFLKHHSLSTFVCIQSDKIVGFVDYWVCRDDDCDEDVGEIRAIYVLPEYIGQNIGKELFSLSTQFLAQKGCNEVVVWALSENTLGRKFYERQGLVPDGKEREYQGLSELRYRKTIAPVT